MIPLVIYFLFFFLSSPARVIGSRLSEDDPTAVEEKAEEKVGKNFQLLNNSTFKSFYLSLLCPCSAQFISQISSSILNTFFGMKRKSFSNRCLLCKSHPIINSIHFFSQTGTWQKHERIRPNHIGRYEYKVTIFLLT